MNRRQFLGSIARAVAVSSAMVYAPATLTRKALSAPAPDGYDLSYAEGSVRGPLWAEASSNVFADGSESRETLLAAVERQMEAIRQFKDAKGQALFRDER